MKHISKNNPKRQSDHIEANEVDGSHLGLQAWSHSHTCQIGATNETPTPQITKKHTIQADLCTRQHRVDAPEQHCECKKNGEARDRLHHFLFVWEQVANVLAETQAEDPK